MKTKQVLMKMLGESPTIKTINFLLNGRDFDYSISDIAEGAGISRMTSYEVIGQLQKKGVVIKTRKQGVSLLYKINLKSRDVEVLFEMYKKLLKNNLKKLKSK